MSGGSGGRRTSVFAPASSGGERRVRTAVGLARRLADLGLRYRLRELQLLAVPCAAAFLPSVFARDPFLSVLPVHPVVLGFVLSLAYLGVNAALSLALPWLDQHLLPVAAMLTSAHYSLAVSIRTEWETHFPLAGALIALYTVLGVRLVRLTVSPVRPRRVRTLRAIALRRWPLWLGAALLLLATAVLTLAAALSLRT